MSPDFPQKTKDILAQRAAYKCSNPECRVLTTGPNTDPRKSTTIGESAHIYGAKPGSARFLDTMTDVLRAEITNGIWLCRNCHKIVDRDNQRFSPELLFEWRKAHENFISIELGKNNVLVQCEFNDHEVNIFADYPPVIGRIVIDKPVGWKYRLTAELMRHLYAPVYRRLDAMDDDYYISQEVKIPNKKVYAWGDEVQKEMSSLIDPLVDLVEKLNNAWNDPSEDDEEEILQILLSLDVHFAKIVSYEEKVKFSTLPVKFKNLKTLLGGHLSSYVRLYISVPVHIDRAITLIEDHIKIDSEKVIEIRKIIVFELPKNWAKEMTRQMTKAIYISDSI